MRECFWPRSFAARGVTVGFTTPTLDAARVRGCGGAVELLVPGLADTEGSYVLPSPAVPTVFGPTVHDRMLTQELTERGPAAAITPQTARRAAAGIAGDAERIDWLLDGWESVLGRWAGSQERQRGEEGQLLPGLVRLVPLIPRDETERAREEQDWAGMLLSMRRQVRNLVGWTSGEPDLELMQRLERYKAALD